MESKAFVDYTRIQVKAGDGGQGCVSFRREKFVPRGGPNGGDGGRGGDVYLMGDPHLATLLDLRYKSFYKAGNGRPGEGSQCSGKNGEHVTIHVPLGTIVYDDKERQIADIIEPNKPMLIAEGGKGGKGNQHFATPTNRAPRRSEPGKEGPELALVLELKAIADVGLVGLPNAGKSTLLDALTNAEPRIASYPFTTLHPNLGVFEYPDDKRLIIADIPGLIEGASTGLGLGDQFLRHIERTQLLIYLVADFEQKLDATELRDQFELVRTELRQYDEKLLKKPFIVALSRSDEWREALGEDLAEDHRALLLAAFEDTVKDSGALGVVTISSHAGEGLAELMKLTRSYFEQTSGGDWLGNLSYIQPELAPVDPHRAETIARAEEAAETEEAEETGDKATEQASSVDSPG